MMICARFQNVFKQARHFKLVARLASQSPLGPGPGRSSVHSSLLEIHAEVAEALVHKEPVVALESTIITHGMPYPENLGMAKEVGNIIRDNGAVPATIALLNGRVHIGLGEDELELLTYTGKEAIKTSRRDFVYVLSQGLAGGTTVSGTMVSAHKAGIPVFVTGGIGGVHRGAQTSFDVSADLTELGRTPVAVICAGAKSILDIELTLEYLETQGVTVATFGATTDFPAFFTPTSGFQSAYSLKTPTEAAEMIDSNFSLGLHSGMLIAVPIPEASAASGEVIEKAIHEALHDAKKSGVKGKEVTPFVLHRVNELTQGESLHANLALVKNNAKVGSQIAVELARIRKEKENVKDTSKQKTATTERHKTRNLKSSYGEDIHTKYPVVIGGSVLDFIATAEQIILEASNPGKVRMTFGGVGRNVAECLARLGMKPLLISAVGGDPLGAMLLKQCEETAMTARGISMFKTKQTATYSAVLSQAGDFSAAVGDMEIHQEITPSYISGFEEPISHAPLVIVDGNISEEAIKCVCDMCATHQIPVWFEPTCILKAKKPFLSEAWQSITYTSPNLNELRTMNLAVTKQPDHRWEAGSSLTGDKEPNERNLEEIIDECLRLCQPLLAHIHCIVVTLGKNGVLVCRNTSADIPFPTAQRLSHLPATQQRLASALHFPTTWPKHEPVEVVNITGAGDSLASAMSASIIQGYEPSLCVKAGLMAAEYSVGCQDAISSSVNPHNFTPQTVQAFAPFTPHHVDISHIQ